MKRKVKDQNTGKTYQLTIATNSYTITEVKKQPNNYLVDNVNGKIYICYNTEYRLPDNYVREE